VSQRVAAAHRRIDALAVALFVAGFALYAYSWAGMRAVIAGRVAADPGHRLVEKVDRLRNIGNLGLIVTLAGVAIGVLALVQHSRRRVGEPSA
jgi:hypothetical protein